MGHRNGAVLGLDLGTGGARCVIASLAGEVLASGEHEIDPAAIRRTEVRHEQDADAWWQAACEAIREARSSYSGEINALSVDGTSGTLVGLDNAGAATTAGLMYNDGRAAEMAQDWNETGSGPKLPATSPLLRMRWLEREEPGTFARTQVFAHQADYLVGKLCGTFGTSDYSNALKSGFDLQQETWGRGATEHAAIRDRLPRVVAPGTDVGSLLPAVAKELGLAPETRVIAGVTDGTAGFLASGARRPGDDSTTLGTTLVFKRLAPHSVDDPTGRVYCHKLPGGLWIPGAASSTGGEWIRENFADADLAHLDREVADDFPCTTLAYPLVGRGERFPFNSTRAEGFVEPAPSDELGRYAAMLQGTALLEALAYELLDELTGTKGGDVFVTGGGSRSDVWLQLRADVIGRELHRPRHADSAFGSAVLAAAGWQKATLEETCERMVHFERSFRPDPERSRAFSPYHARFREALERRGYLPKTEDAPRADTGNEKA